jgi:hypothetical protein
LELTEEELVAIYPRLWHMAHDGAWPAIRQDGLMSAKALITAYAVPPTQRRALSLCRRAKSVRLAHAGRPGAVLRDQKPMSDTALLKCLQDGLTPRDWYELLNSHTFFWLSRDRIWRLLGARAYRGVSQTVLTINTGTLVAAHRERIRLSPINSGSTIMTALPRGLNMFRRIEDFPFHERARTRGPASNVIELLVEHSVPDIAEHVLAVHHCRNDQIVETIWRSPKANAHDRP